MAENKALQKRPVDLLKQELERPAMQNWLQKQIATTMNRNAAQLINVILHAARNNERLGRCTPGSIINCLSVSAQIGLVPNTALQHAFLVPFLNSRKQGGQWVKVMEATLIIGYPGLVKLINDASGVGIKAAPVYSNEPFDYNRAGNPPVTLHKHAPAGLGRGEFLFAYCLAHFPNGVTTGEIYDEEFINERRARSKSYLDPETKKPRKDSPWVTSYGAMALKTAIRAFSNQVPKGSDQRLERAIEVDDLDSADSKLGIAAMVDDKPPLEMSYDDMDAGCIEAGDPEVPQLESGEVDSWIAAIRECDSQRALDEVLTQVRDLPKGEQRTAIERVAIQQADALRTGRKS